MNPEDREKQVEALARACKEFPPLEKLLNTLSNIERTPGSREDLCRVIEAQFYFLVATGHPSLGVAVNCQRDLCFALDDLDQGKNPPLFKSKSRASSRAKPGSELMAMDYLISAYQYLTSVKCLPADFARQQLQRDLSGGGYKLTVAEIDNKIRHNRADKNRKSNRPDVRVMIQSDEQYQYVISQIIYLIFI